MAIPMALPALLLTGIDKAGLTPRGRSPLLALKLSLITLQLLVTVPASMACYPQYQRINARDLEQRFHNLQCELTGQLIREFTYNKGL